MSQDLTPESIIAFALEVFESEGAADQWLSTPSFGLGDVIPKDLLASPEGLQLVYKELAIIGHGHTG